MALSGNQFAKNQPAKSVAAFANGDPTPAVGSFNKERPGNGTRYLFAGDNTSAGVYGGDTPTSGTVYGQDNYGGLAHFVGRPNNTLVHT